MITYSRKQLLYLTLYTLASNMRMHFLCFFFFNDTATTEIYTLSLHDALPIFPSVTAAVALFTVMNCWPLLPRKDRKSTRLNSSHVEISYAVFCLKKKKK